MSKLRIGGHRERRERAGVRIGSHREASSSLSVGDDNSLALLRAGITSERSTESETTPTEESPPGARTDWSEITREASAALTFALDMWRFRAGFKGIQVMGAKAVGSPGCLQGPDFAELLRAAPAWAPWSGEQGGIRDAIVETVASAFERWRSGVGVPGLPWYPSFDAFPGPMAPPTPNTPMPLVVCASEGLGALGQLSTTLVDALAPTTEDDGMIRAWSARAGAAFTMWVQQTAVMGVLATGPVPTFNPQTSPVGPVVGGTIVETPGHLMAGPGLLLW